MSFDPTTTTASMMTYTSTQTEYTSSEVIEIKTRPIDEIREKGFAQFLKDLKEEQLEKLRAKILQSMGYSEDDLESMSPEQRLQIEDMVAREMMERMIAKAEMNGGTGTVVASYQHVEVEVTQVQVTSTLAAGSGLGVLLAAQDVNGSEYGGTALGNSKK